MNYNKVYFYLSINLWLITLGACAYNFAVNTNILQGNIKKICIQIPANNTYLTGFEIQLTNDLIDEFLRRNINCHNDCDKAEALLSGKIISAEINSVSKTGIGDSLEKQIHLSLDINLRNKKDEIIWFNNNLKESESFKTSTEIENTLKNKKQALERLSKKISENIFSQLTENF